MIIYTRTFSLCSGKEDQAIAYLVETAKWINEHYPVQAIAAYVTDLAITITTAAFRYGGGGALYQPNSLERLLRDILAAGQHMAVGDQSYEVHGRHLLGLDGA